MKKFNLHCALLAAILAASAVPVVAETANESEPNDPIAAAQQLTTTVPSGTTVSSEPPKGSATVNGILGVLGPLIGPRALDLDFYTFQGQAGDVVTIDIDGGMKRAGSTDRSVDTVLGVFGPGPAYKLLRMVDDIPLTSPADEGSIPSNLSTGKGSRDALIENLKLEATGSYTVGVSSFPRLFKDGGTTTRIDLNNQSNGAYTLVISGVSSPLLHITIDIKPGDGDSDAPINPKSQGKIPVALLSSSDFKAADVDVATLRFGDKGTEASLSKCGQSGEDVNGDDLLDLVCHFENQLTDFSASSEEGILTGKTGDGRSFEGRGRLKVVPKKRPF